MPGGEDLSRLAHRELVIDDNYGDRWLLLCFDSLITVLVITRCCFCASLLVVFEVYDFVIEVGRLGHVAPIWQGLLLSEELLSLLRGQIRRLTDLVEDKEGFLFRLLHILHVVVILLGRLLLKRLLPWHRAGYVLERGIMSCSLFQPTYQVLLRRYIAQGVVVLQFRCAQLVR